MKVKFCIDSGANIYSRYCTGWLDTVDDIGMDEGEWEEMTHEQKYEATEEYLVQNGRPEIWFEESEDE